MPMAEADARETLDGWTSIGVRTDIPQPGSTTPCSAARISACKRARTNPLTRFGTLSQR
jgi:hypothetical protein